MIALLLAVSLAAPPEYLTAVQGDPIETAGTASEIATRGETCMASNLDSGAAGGEVIVSRDLARGVVVATSAIEYRDGIMGSLRWQMRSRLTLEARDGRFRLGHSNIERFNDQSIDAQMLRANPWAPVGKWRGSGWQKAEEALKATSATIAECINAPASASDW